MIITHISIRNYRSLKAVDINIDDYTALIGANGSGKSCVLYALEWFINGQPLQASDIYGYSKDGEPDESGLDTTISVTITFDSLSDQDKNRLKQYGHGGKATFRRSWTLGDDKDKVVGNAMQGPGFAEIRQMTRVTEMRPAYSQLTRTVSGLPDLGSSPSKEVITEALAVWEADSNNMSQLVRVNDDDANHMFGYNGPNVIKDCIHLVLVPAAANIATEVGSSGRGSALNELVGSMMSKASAEARAEWLAKNASKIDELNRLVKESVERSTGLQETRINSQLAKLVPNATLKFTPEVPAWSPKNEATIATDVTIDGITNDVSRQGHGVQRAVMISMFQSLAPDEALASGNHKKHDGETEEAAAERLREEIDNLPVLIICIEEPEIYQHPIRARTFARILTDLAAQQSTQVLIATHSPYFITPTQFPSLRRFRLESGVTTVSSTSVTDVAVSSGCTETQVEKIVEKRLPTSFSEGFFCDLVVVVEGDTDKIVLETLAAQLDLALDSRGISVIEMSGKGGLRIPHSIFRELNTPVYVVVDGDALGAARKHPRDVRKRTQAHATHQADTNQILAWLPTSRARFGALPYSFGDTSVVANHFTIWEDDIEEELAKWPSFVTALASNGSYLRSKDLLAYRNAVLDADVNDCPEVLKKCIEAIVAFS